MKAEEIRLKVNDIELVAQRWTNFTAASSDANSINKAAEKNTGQRVLCLHGWLDNSASFEKTAPLLNGCDVVALDMAGQGLSGHRSAHGSYNLWDDIEDVRAVADALGWDNFNLLGHSRGAFVSILFAAVLPERVQRLVLIDGLVPLPQDVDFLTQLRRYIIERSRDPIREVSAYATEKDALTRRKKSYDLNAADLMPIVQRDLKESDAGFIWRHDARLHVSSAVKLDSDGIQAVLKGLVSPALLMVADKGIIVKFISDDSLKAMLEHDSITACYHSGGHHFHTDSQYAEGVAKIIERWFVSGVYSENATN